MEQSLEVSKRHEVLKEIDDVILDAKKSVQALFLCFATSMLNLSLSCWREGRGRALVLFGFIYFL
jgi:hypothetical protein